VNIFGGKRLHQAAKRQVGHRKIRCLASDKEAGNVEIAHPHRDRKDGGAMSQPQVDQRQIRRMSGRGSDRPVQVVCGCDDPIAWIVLHQILQCCRQLDVIFDDQDIQHRPRPSLPWINPYP